jgi:predicted acyl esterase
MPNGASSSSKRPAILDQSPYPVQAELTAGRNVLSRLVRKGYVLAVVNDRGTQWSEGEYRWLKGATADGVDTIKWITGQDWSSGSVGTWGCSSSGEVNFALAKVSPPGLKAIVAMGAATGIGLIPGFADQGVFYTGGVPLFDWAWWYHGDGYIHHPKLPPNVSHNERVALIHAFNPLVWGGMSQDLSWADHLPSQDLLNAIGSPETGFNTLIKMKPNDPNWRSYDFLNEGDKTTVPMLHIDTWYDSIEAYGTTKAFQYLSNNSPNQYLIMGAGSHCSMGKESERTMVGPRPVGDARFDYAGTVVAWFDHWLKEAGQGDFKMPHVQYYPLESNRWVSADAWPPPSTSRKLYLTSNGRANSLGGDGQLIDHPGSGAPDHFTSDPMHPVPTNGGGCCTADAALDQTDIEKRPDVLVYTSAVLPERLNVAGFITATVYFSTSVPDTDLALKLVDVYPDGKAYNVLDTIQRLRFRDGIDKESLMQKDAVYKVELREMVTASQFAPGHRIRIELAGTNFPQYERNMNTGGRNYDEDKPVVAEDVVYHDAARPSALDLPVVP